MPIQRMGVNRPTITRGMGGTARLTPLVMGRLDVDVTDDATIAGLVANPASDTGAALVADFVPRYIDDTGAFTDFGATQTIRTEVEDPTAWVPVFMVRVAGNGDDTNFRGVAAGYFVAEDLATVTSADKGVLYAIQGVVSPIVDRDNVPYDDVVGLSIENQGAARGTDGIYLGHNRSDEGTNPTGQDWQNAIQVDAFADNMIRGIGTFGVGLSLSGATCTVAAIRLANAQKLSWLKADGVTLQEGIRLDTSDVLRIMENLKVFTTGAVGIPNNVGYEARNAANSAQVELLRLTGSDNLALYGAKVTLLGNGGELVAATGSVPSAPSAGVVARYSNAGTYQAKTSTGTVTTLAGDVVTKSANATLTLADQVVLGTGGGGGITITLPTAVNAKGQRHVVKKVDAGAGAVTVGTTSSQTIDGSTTHALSAQYAKVTVISDGANWHIIA